MQPIDITRVNADLAKLQGLPATVHTFDEQDVPDANMLGYLTHNNAIWEGEPAIEDGINGSKKGYHKGVFLDPVSLPSPEGNRQFVCVAYVSPAIYAQIAAAQEKLG